MNYLFDTSVLIAGILAAHPHHKRAKPWIAKVIQGKVNMFVCNHSIAELYAVLTRLPVSPKISPGNALALIEHNVIKVGNLVNLTSRDYHRVLEGLVRDHLSGGLTYDGLIYYAALKSGVDNLLTLNKKDFDRFNSNDAIKIHIP